MLQEVLQDYGLTAKEANVYIACLELGSAPASTIARRLGENRVTTYSNLKNLIKKGIAMTVEKKKTTYYSSISPKQFLRKMEDRCAFFKEKLPEFMAFEGKYDNKPKIQYFE